MRRYAFRRCFSSAVTATRFCPTTHTRLRITSDARVFVGLTQRSMQDIGDATALDFSPSPVGTRRKAAAADAAALLCKIEWEAMRISDGDELYHTTWANIHDEALVHWPPSLSGRVQAVNEHLAQRVEEGSEVEECDWLVEIAVDDVRVLEGPELLSECAYMRALEKVEPGLFADKDATLSYTSYG